MIQSALEQGELLILDGAIGSEIKRLGGDMDATAWCGLANRDHPDVVREVHAGYLRAGANIVTANTFATCRHVLAPSGAAADAPAISAAGVRLCREAIDLVAPERPVAVAGSMSNQMAWIPGTFSPDPRYAPSPVDESANYREYAEALAEAGADMLLLEMMQDITHASRLAEAASTAGLPLWIGISCSVSPDGDAVAWDMHLEEPATHIHAEHERSDAFMPLTQVIDAMLAFDPQVMGIMHSGSVSMQTGLDAVRERWPGPLLAYPESTNHHWVKPAAFAANCRSWVEAGVQVIGGCCGTTVNHIQTMVEEVGDLRSRA